LSAPWPEPVQRVSAFLRHAGAEARIEEFPEGTPTAEDAAKAVGSGLDQIVKSLVFDCDGRPVLTLVPGNRRANPRKVAKAAGCGRARVAGPDRVREVTGFEPGAVAPFPLPGIERVVVDPRLLRHDRVWIGAGSPRHLAPLPPAELVRLTRGESVDVSEESP
jgi:prolyl-tRNA editing enzyme YbaK/EbsC (Cys-tRNA(Pro) deacylase)